MSLRDQIYAQQESLRKRLENGFYQVAIPGQRRKVYLNNLQMYAVMGVGCNQIARGMRPVVYSINTPAYMYTDSLDDGLWLPTPSRDQLYVDYRLRSVLEEKQLVTFAVIEETYRIDRWGDSVVDSQTYGASLTDKGWVAFGMLIAQYSAEILAGRIIPNFSVDAFNPEVKEEEVEEEDEAHADLGRFRGIF